jgi:hypothetical protein
MNERIKELINEATSFKEGLIEGKYDIEEFDKEKFAELIIEDACRVLNPMLRDMISRGQAVDLIRKNFEQRPGWVCPQCGVDRTKDVCPKGHTAAITGECPMTASAQTGE